VRGQQNNASGVMPALGVGVQLITEKRGELAGKLETEADNEPSLHSPPPDEITRLINAANAGDLSARDRIVREIYPQLRRIARSRLNQHMPPTLLDATALLHESLARLLDRGFEKIENSQHLVAYAAAAMRSVLVDYARERNAVKRDAGERVSLTFVEGVSADASLDLVLLDEAMRRLDTVDARLTTIVELRCFAGLTMDQIATEIGVSVRTVKRDWHKARSFLKMFIDDSAQP
jgi:RNA polymerase sigma factor (TIGR02999 family)